MGIMAYSLLWVMQALDHQPCLVSFVRGSPQFVGIWGLVSWFWLFGFQVKGLGFRVSGLGV